MVTVRRALLSVTDKSGLVDFAHGLRSLGIELISTGGTAKTLRAAGIEVKDISEHTGFPEMLDGRVKTLHPRIHGGLLHLRDNPEHLKTIAKHGIEPIDMVVVNLYPFQLTVADPACSLEAAVENIDIGGPSMIRSGAKNFRSVAVLTQPARYPEILAEMLANHGAVGDATLESLVVEAFAHTAEFDRSVHAYLQFKLQGEPRFPQELSLRFTKAQALRYGENPHQHAAFYVHPGEGGPNLGAAEQLQGKELSYNNIADLDAALNVVKEFKAPAVAIIKHANPCGVALGPETKTGAAEAYQKAFDADPVSAFGGIVACNRAVDTDFAEKIGATFLECLIAPGFSAGALAVLGAKKNLRLMKTPFDTPAPAHPPGLGYETFAMKKVAGGLLLQTRDTQRVDRADCRVVTKRAPTEAEWADLLFAWRVVVHVKSNAILLAKDGATLGVGPGQTNRVGSVEIAARAAGMRAKGSVLASDAFFPFPDGLLAGIAAGVTAVIQPGGSVNDAKVITAADQAGIAMVFTGMRHFFH
ncbi:MAG TPA: bifunctional phosphoribosylaminoimidazolecarboxamide formyltransferase/IMP cyclohydrolase [bacterium]|nr:bifunctional phosphoribosylaminoimidazolecarboxamide formyltransferase/IMP cyclohydrolase [bacterium]